MAVRPEELAANLVARYRAAQADHAFRAQRIRSVLGPALREELAGRAHGARCRAWLMGSLAHGTFGAASDVDIVVEGVPAEIAPELWLALERRLDAPVDLLRLEELPPAFRERVLAEGVPIDVA
jgi:predicted nucleotidyltransferase